MRRAVSSLELFVFAPALLVVAAVTSPVWLLWLWWQHRTQREQALRETPPAVSWPDFTRQSECQYLARLDATHKPERPQ